MNEAVIHCNVEFTFHLLKCLKSDTVIPLTPIIWSPRPSEEIQKTPTREKLKMNLFPSFPHQGHLNYYLCSPGAQPSVLRCFTEFFTHNASIVGRVRLDPLRQDRRGLQIPGVNVSTREAGEIESLSVCLPALYLENELESPFIYSQHR
ncbi:hypothetical protein J6590_070960, partial [Homalodisca vitripennis]